MKKTNKNLTSFSDHLDSQYGKKGTATRRKYESEFDDFKSEVMKENTFDIKSRNGDSLSNYKNYKKKCTDMLKT
jgi:HTH-type transcriptional regulator/antitoxin HipB